MYTSLSSNVSHETIDIYIALIKKWNKSTFLIQKDTIQEFESRHFNDSIQLLSFLSKTSKILDIGSGAGLPGMILALAGMRNITLCESNKKKCLFLAEVSRETNTKVNIVNKRAEDLDKHMYDVLIARGFASLDKLIMYMKLLDIKEGVFLKGENAMKETNDALTKYNFQYQIHNSVTSDTGKIVVIKIA